jgi:nucleoside-diphosphate-sugar epimerase
MDGYLVTGGAGFVGSALARALVERGFRPRVLDNLSTGKLENLDDVRDRIDFLQGDLRDPAVAARACQGMRFVLHEAALPSVPRSLLDPVGCHENNATGTLNLLLAARDAGVKRVVYAGSSSAYGNTPMLPKVETMPTAPLSPYAVSKIAGEHYCLVFFRAFGLETVVLRYFNVFGPRQDPASQYAAVVPRFLRAYLDGEPPVIYGDGQQSRDFTYVDNVVQANLLATEAPGAAGEVINVACGERVTLLDLCRQLEQLTACHVAPRFDPERRGDVKHSLASIEKARALLGYVPGVGLAEGLRRLVEWTRARRA